MVVAVAAVVAAAVVEEEDVGVWIHRVRHILAEAGQLGWEMGPSCPRNHCDGVAAVVVAVDDAAGDVLHNPCLRDPKLLLPETGPVGDYQTNCQKQPNASPNGRYRRRRHHQHYWEKVHQKYPNVPTRQRNGPNAPNSGERRLELWQAQAQVRVEEEEPPPEEEEARRRGGGVQNRHRRHPRRRLPR